MVGAQALPRHRPGAPLDIEAVEWVCGGQFHDTDPGEIDANNPQTELTFRMTLSRVKLTIAGDVIWDIDGPQGLCIIDGTDLWQELKTRLSG